MLRQCQVYDSPGSQIAQSPTISANLRCVIVGLRPGYKHSAFGSAGRTLRMLRFILRKKMRSLKHYVAIIYVFAL